MSQYFCPRSRLLRLVFDLHRVFREVILGLITWSALVVITKSARLFQERTGLHATLRGPYPTLDFDAHRIHSLPLVPPLPPGELGPSQGAPPPDRGPTAEWPFPGS